MHTVTLSCPSASSLALVLLLACGAFGAFGACGGQEHPAASPEYAPPAAAVDGGPPAAADGAPPRQSEYAPPPGAQPSPTQWPGAMGATNPMPTAGGVPTAPPAATGTSQSAEPSSQERSTQAPVQDDQILQSLHEANAGAIAQANLATTKAKDGEVKKFALSVWRGHTALDEKGDAIAKKEHLSMQSGPISDAIRRDRRQGTDSLEAATASSFDAAYLDAVIREQQSIIDTIDQKLAPSVQNADVKAYLADFRRDAAAHLQRAQELRDRIRK